MTAEAPAELTAPEEWGESRSRTVTWHDPLVTAAGAMQRSGLEWSYRLYKEPRRLWRRYVLGIPRFGVGILREGSLPSAGAIAASGAHWANWIFVVAELVFGSGLVVLGYGLWLHRDESVRPGPPEQRASVR